MRVSFDEHGPRVDGQLATLQTKYPCGDADDHYVQILQLGGEHSDYLVLLKDKKGRIVPNGRYPVRHGEIRSFDIEPGAANDPLGTLVRNAFDHIPRERIVLHDDPVAGRPRRSWKLPDRADEPAIFTDGQLDRTPVDKDAAYHDVEFHIVIVGATYAVVTTQGTPDRSPILLELHLAEGAEFYLDAINTELAKVTIPPARRPIPVIRR